MLPKMPPVKLACLTCRASRTRCDGAQPCYNCRLRQQNCLYQPSKRGGSRKSSAKKGLVGKFEQTPHRINDTGDIDRLLDRGAGLGHRKEPSNSTASFQQADTYALRVYGDNESLLNAYYLYIHPFFPVLPPPVAALSADIPVAWTPQNLDDLPYASQQSPLVLSIALILVLMELPDARTQDRQTCTDLRARTAHRLAKRIWDQVDSITESGTHWSTRQPERPSDQMHALHPNVPEEVECVIALVILGNYEHVQRGNLARMASRIGHATVLARSLSLHQQGAEDDEFSEARRRAWWMTYAYGQLCLLVAGDIALGSGNEDEIGTTFPRLDNDTEIWYKYITALRLSVQAKQLSERRKLYTQSSEEISEAYQQALKLDEEIQVQLSDLSPASEDIFLGSGSEAISLQVLRRLCRIKLASSRIRIHRRHAFADISVFTKGTCDFSASSTPTDVQGPELTLTTFDYNESVAICTDSGLVISRQLQKISALKFVDTVQELPCSMPVSTCCALQASYVLLMQLYCTRILSQDQSQGFSILTSTERFEEELRHGLQNIIKGLGVQAKIFDSIGSMKEEIEVLVKMTV